MRLKRVFCRIRVYLTHKCLQKKMLLKLSATYTLLTVMTYVSVTNVSVEANSVDSDQTAPGAV